MSSIETLKDAVLAHAIGELKAAVEMAHDTATELRESGANVAKAIADSNAQLVVTLRAIDSRMRDYNQGIREASIDVAKAARSGFERASYRVGMWLVLASIAGGFAAGLGGSALFYWLIRTSAA